MLEAGPKTRQAEEHRGYIGPLSRSVREREIFKNGYDYLLKGRLGDYPTPYVVVSPLEPRDGG